MGITKAEASRSPDLRSRNLDVEPIFVHRSVMAPTEQHQVVESRFSTIGPVLDVMRITEAEPTAWEAAAAVPVVQRPPDGWRYCPGSSADIEHGAVGVMRHDHTARITGDAPRRSRGNAYAVL